MTTTQWAIAAHLLVLAVWLGTDVATFTISKRVVDPALSAPIRLALAGAMMRVEIFARLCLPAMLGLGLLLSQSGGYVSVSSAVGAGALLLGIAWMGLVWTIHKRGDQAIGSTLTKIDLAIRSVVCGLLWIAAVASIVGDGPFHARWLGVKVALFALIMTCGISIRFLLRPFSAAFGEILSSGSTPDREQRLQAAIKRAQPFVAVIWTCLVIATILGVGKPTL